MNKKNNFQKIEKEKNCNNFFLYNNTFNIMNVVWQRFFNIIKMDSCAMQLLVINSLQWTVNSLIAIDNNFKLKKKKNDTFVYSKQHLKKTGLFYGVFFNIWDYLKISWSVKELALTGTSPALLEKMILTLFKKYLTGVLVKEHFVEFLIKDNWYFKGLLNFFKKSSLLSVNLFVDLFGRETFFKTKNLILIYNCISEQTNTRFIFRVVLKNSFIMVSVTDVFISAGWAERECWDMLGVVFLGNKDLRRILTDYGFLGHPLRKEFPLTGFVEVRYNDSLKRIVFEPVEFAQEMRAFDFSNPWNPTITLGLSENPKVFKTLGGGDIDFMGVLSNTITKTNLEANVLRNFKIRYVFSRSNTTQEYLRNHNAIFMDITSNWFFIKNITLNKDSFFDKYNEIWELFNNHIFLFLKDFLNKTPVWDEYIPYFTSNQNKNENGFYASASNLYLFTFLSTKHRKIKQSYSLFYTKISKYFLLQKNLYKNEEKGKGDEKGIFFFLFSSLELLDNNTTVLTTNQMLNKKKSNLIFF